MIVEQQRRPPRVGPTERDFILVARALFTSGSYPSVEGVLRTETRCDGLTRSAMRLFEDALAKGCVRALARHGYRSVPRVTKAGTVQPGRIWEARPEYALALSPFAFELCRWLVAQPLGRNSRVDFKHAPITACDELLAYLLCGLVEGELLEPTIASQSGIRASALAWLGFPGMLAAAGQPKEVRAGCERLASDGMVLEAMQDDLAARAVAFERLKATVAKPATLATLGETREQVLGALLDALEGVQRHELATFLVDAGATLLPSTVNAADTASMLVTRLDPSTSLRERAAARHASGAHLRALVRLGKHHEEARNARFFDEAYGRAQLVLARWEHLGNHGFSRAAEVLVQLDALDRG